MNPAQTGGDAARRKAVRRHRRERQFVVFGIAMIALVTLAFASFAIYRGDVEGPFDRAFHTPAGEFQSDVTLACAPSGAMPLPPEEVVVRVNNAAGISGLAGSTGDTLEGRGFVVVDATNWTQDFAGTIRILYGAEGLQHAYTVALHFDDVELVLDNRPGITVDIVLGEQFGEQPQVRELDAPELDPTLALSSRGECLPVNVLTARPAPRTLPENPLAEASPSPSPEPEITVEE
ncbi:LytR C-terminal domain-containing protein [Demequina muriae]|uniref:LytR C-terminal domain-containing protein n=1 Tax=Demequina muriae TaxID=3051664 RepID=A0ABT8GGZ3_9MICO|nr:LytR C-terminal domain-containing protein [Demequina sp. EGI L300058]MDN4480707.1 LytR C-terminal domain-containing protein [Demequina sp. EGI L300058]